MGQMCRGNPDYSKINMKIKIIEDNFDKKTYNARAVNPMQSWEWGEAKAKTGVKILRFGQFDNQNLKNVFLMTLHKIPYTNRQLGYIPHSSIPTTEVLDFLTDYGKKNRLVFIKFEPYVKKQKNYELQTINDKLIKSSHPLFPTWTIMLDLAKPEEELFKNFKTKTRYNIRLAQKKGITVKEESNKEGFNKFIKLYFETCSRQKYFGHNLKYHKTIWENLKNNIAHIMIAYYKDQPLVAYELFLFNNILYYPYGGSSVLYRNFMPANLLMWEAIKFGKKHGSRKFDMWGSLPPHHDQNNLWSGFTRFKEGYNGEFIEFAGSYDLVISPTIYKIYNLANIARNFYLNLRLKFT